MADSNGPVILEHFSLYSHTTKVNPNTPPEHKIHYLSLAKLALKEFGQFFLSGFSAYDLAVGFNF